METFTLVYQEGDISVYTPTIITKDFLRRLSTRHFYIIKTIC